jgi:transposase
MVIIGVDPHKRTHTASALEPGSHRVLATLQIDATLAGYRQLARWVARFEVRRWAVENARGLGRHLAQWLAVRMSFERSDLTSPSHPPAQPHITDDLMGKAW